MVLVVGVSVGGFLLSKILFVTPSLSRGFWFLLWFDKLTTTKGKQEEKLNPLFLILNP
jgi:hypothetical protein